MKTVPSPNPHGIQLYDITAFERVEDIDGVWWIEAYTTCGHQIGAIMFSSTSFGVAVSKGDRTIRQYSGGPGSDAEKVFRGFYEEYLTRSAAERETIPTR